MNTRSKVLLMPASFLRARDCPTAHLLALAVVVSGLAGCDSAPPTRAVSIPPAARALTPAVVGTPHNLDDEFAIIADAAPGFGGLVRDSTGQLIMYLVDAAQEGRAHAALGPLMRRLHIVDTGIRVRSGRYDYRTLRSWKGQLPEVLSIPGTVFTDLDETHNRLRVGIETLALRPRVEAVLVRRGIPLDAVMIEQSPAVHFAVGLQDRMRPTTGGLQIAFGNFACTLGYVAKLGPPSDTARYGITNSHCSDVQGGVEGTLYYQPTVAAGNFIGTELLDPPYRTYGITDWNCPPSRRCRFSDAAMFQYAAQADANYGYLTRTLSRGSMTGSLTQDPGNPLFAIDTMGTLPSVGQEVNKVGRTTGWTFGRVESTCIDTDVGGTDITLHCQDLVHAGADHGDSGSPVFTNGYTYNGQSYVTVYGILWGVFDPTHDRFAMSQLNYMQNELGYFTLCTPQNFNC